MGSARKLPSAQFVPWLANYATVDKNYADEFIQKAHEWRNQDAIKFADWLKGAGQSLPPELVQKISP
jgi:hypothetical protein